MAVLKIANVKAAIALKLENVITVSANTSTPKNTLNNIALAEPF
jgi:hypothetical protein